MNLHTALFYNGSSRAGSCNSLLQLIQPKMEPFAVEERRSQAPIRGGSPCDWAGAGEMHAWCVEKGPRFRQPVAAGSESQEGYGTPKTLDVTVLPTEDHPRKPDESRSPGVCREVRVPISTSGENAIKHSLVRRPLVASSCNRSLPSTRFDKSYRKAYVNAA